MRRHWYQQYTSPDVPFCIIGKVSWGVTQAIKVPETIATRYLQHGWSVLVRDSDFPVQLYGEWNADIDPEVPALHSNPRRREDEGDPA